MMLPRVYPILDTETLGRRGLGLTCAAAALLEGGAGILQIRHKRHWSRNFFEETARVAQLCREYGALLVVNDRADMALLLDAGVHVGQDDLLPRDVRRLLGSVPVLGFSTHNRQQLSTAGGEPVSYVALGPVFSTPSKQNPDPVLGVEEFGECRGLVEKPLVAIGGITRANAASVFAAGADAVAVIGDLFPEPCGARAVRERMEEWQRLTAV